MNTHDKYELPPLPDWFAGYSEADKHVVRLYAYAAIEADRKRRGEPVAWYTEDHLTDRSATTYDPIVAERWRVKGWPVSPLFKDPQPAEPVNEEELLAAREALIDMGYLWDGDQWVDVDPPSKTVEQAPEWPDFACMEASLQRLKERLVFENGRRKDLEQRLREKRNG